MHAEVQAVIELLVQLITTPQTGVLIILLGTAAWFDWRTQRIPNYLIFGGTVLGLALNSLVPATPEVNFLWSLAGLATGLMLLLPLYMLSAMGAADVKLMAMTGAFLGMPATFYAVLATLLAGGLLAVIFALSQGVLRHMLLNLSALLQSAWLNLAVGQRPSLSTSLSTTAGKLPYGLAIAGGTIAYLVLRQLGIL